MKRSCMFVTGIASLLAVSGSATAGIIHMGNGWDAIIHNQSLSDITVDSSTLDEIVIQKSAQFNDLEPIFITFVQVLPDALTAPRICITDEVIFNNSGFDWIDFHMSLLNAGEAVFNVADSAGFDFAPFTTRTYTEGDSTVNFFGGPVLDGSFWFPGLPGGELCIDIDLSATGPVVFTLKERPTIPAPGSMALGGLAGIIIIARRRRR